MKLKDILEVARYADNEDICFKIVITKSNKEIDLDEVIMVRRDDENDTPVDITLLI